MIHKLIHLPSSRLSTPASWLFVLATCLLALVSFSSCSSSPSVSSSPIYTPSHSTNFSISTLDTPDSLATSLISSSNPWQGASGVSAQLLISKGNPVPDDFSGQILPHFARRIICMSSTHIAMLQALGVSDRIVGVSGKEYISNSSIRENPDIPDIGYEGFIDYETLAAQKPDLVLLFSVNGASAMEPKLRELNIPYLYIGDYVEESPLGKAEWIVPVAEVVGLRDKGIQKFKDIEARYLSLRDSVAALGLSHPKVMVNAPFLDSWFMPSTSSYIARLISDASADYVYTKDTGNSSRPIDLEEALSLVSQADYWINIGTLSSLSELKSSFPKFSSAPCVTFGNVFNNNRIKSPGGGNDCYESGVVNPDVILRDMVNILHPGVITDSLTYYHRLE